MRQVQQHAAASCLKWPTAAVELWLRAVSTAPTCPKVTAAGRQRGRGVPAFLQLQAVLHRQVLFHGSTSRRACLLPGGHVLRLDLPRRQLWRWLKLIQRKFCQAIVALLPGHLWRTCTVETVADE